MRETWRPIPGLDGYEASDKGRVRSWRGYGGTRREKPRVRKATPNHRRGGYHVITFVIDGRSLARYVHHLVVAAFGRRPRKGQTEVRHKDGNPANNALTNLTWSCHKVNMRDQVLHGTHTKGHQNGNAKLTPRQVEAIRRSILSGRALAQKYGVHESTICRVRKGRRYV